MEKNILRDKDILHGFFLFYVKHGAKVKFKEGREEIFLNFPPVDENKPSSDSVFFAPFDQIRKLTQRCHLMGNKFFVPQLIVDKKQALDYFNLPPDFSCYNDFVSLETRLLPFKGRERINVAFVAFGGALGDTLVGKTSLEILDFYLRTYFSEVNFMLYPIKPKSFPILKQIPDVRSIRLLPAPVSFLKRADFYFDFSMMTGHRHYNTLPMIDYFLFHIGIDPSSIPPEKKRCSYRISDDVVKELEPIVSSLKEERGPFLLYHFRATSKVRSIPPQFIFKHIKALINNTDFTVVTLLPCKFKHPRFLDLSGLSKTFDHFAYLVSRMDAIITVDTVTVYLADAFSVPTVVLFTSIPPELRIKYYPHQRGILIGARDGKPLYYCHHTDKKRVLSLFRKAWRDFSILEAVNLLFERRRAKPSSSQQTAPGSPRLESWEERR